MAVEREVVERKDGGVEVRSKTRARKLTAARKKTFLAAVAAGNTITGAAKLVGVSTQTVTNERRRDEVFDRQVDEAREGFAEHLESEAYKRAVTGVEKVVYFKGVPVGKERVYSDRLLETMLAANNRRYKRDDAAKVAVVVAPLSTQELMAARDIGRENVEALDAVAREFVELEREADQRRAGSGG